MRIILYKWNANNESALYNALLEMNYEVICFQKECKDYTRDMDLASELIQLVVSYKADAVISFNYFPIISVVCDVTDSLYYSWVYDNPHLTLYAKTISLPNNRIFIFDREMVDELKLKGISNAMHLPLATDVTYYSRVISNSRNIGKYRSDVSFVGSLYTDAYNYFDKFYGINTPEVIANIVSTSMFKRDNAPELVRFGEEPMGMQYVIQCMKNEGLLLGEDYLYNPEDIVLQSVLDRKITSMERTTLMKKLSEDCNIDFALYTGSITDIPNRGIVDYKTEMPLVFNQSKININMSLKSIRAGIPLRVIDIMACGGFVLSNRQPELIEYFAEDKEVVCFESLEEFFDKLYYYLKNEKARINIAKAGYDKVSKQFTYEKMMKKMFGIKK